MAKAMVRLFADELKAGALDQGGDGTSERGARSFLWGLKPSFIRALQCTS
jgi:hypothetical protein